MLVYTAGIFFLVATTIHRSAQRVTRLAKNRAASHLGDVQHVRNDAFTVSKGANLCNLRNEPIHVSHNSTPWRKDAALCKEFTQRAVRNADDLTALTIAPLI